MLLRLIVEGPRLVPALLCGTTYCRPLLPLAMIQAATGRDAGFDQQPYLSASARTKQLAAQSNPPILSHCIEVHSMC